MTHGERSLLFYILDIAEKVPENISKVLWIINVETEVYSKQFCDYINELQSVSSSTTDTKQKSYKIRKEIL